MDSHHHRHCGKLYRRIDIVRNWSHRQVGVDREARREARNPRQAEGEGRPLGCVVGTPVVGTIRGRHLRSGTRILPLKIHSVGDIYAHRQGRPLRDVVPHIHSLLRDNWYFFVKFCILHFAFCIFYHTFAALNSTKHLIIKQL